MGLSKSKGSSGTTDQTPEAFKNLQQPFAELLKGLMGTGDNPGSGLPAYEGPLTADVTGAEKQTLGQIGNFTRQGNPGQGVLNGIATAPVKGPMTAQGAQNFTDGLGIGAVAPVGYKPQGTLADFAARLQGAQQTEGYDPNGNNPFVRGAIDAAQRSTMDNLSETVGRVLPGRFTQAGHFVNPEGSSAFDRAAGVATRGAAQEMGDIAQTISYEAFNAERDRQFTAEEGARTREAQQLASELERRGQYGEAARVRQQAAREAGAEREATATGNTLDREAQVREGALDRQQEAAVQGTAVRETELNNLIKALEAQGLPRLVQESGIDRGTEMFNERMNQLLTTLGIVGGTTRPVQGQQSSQSSTGINLGGK